jgi:hypothetical protein
LITPSSKFSEEAGKTLNVIIQTRNLTALPSLSKASQSYERSWTDRQTDKHTRHSSRTERQKQQGRYSYVYIGRRRAAGGRCVAVAHAMSCRPCRRSASASTLLAASVGWKPSQKT